ncbi:MAG: hypothetical protein ABEJ35_01950 [Halobacteriaceae archaeon]
MTEAAAREGVEHYLDRLVEHAYQAFDVGAALEGTGGAGGRLIGRLLEQSDALDRRIVRPELRRYRDAAMAQFDAILRYAADDAAPSAHRDALLADDQYAAAMVDDLSAARREAVRDALVDRAVRVGDAVAPIVAAPQDDFWAAVVHAYDETAAREAVTDAVSFTGPLESYPDAFAFRVQLDPADFLGPLGAAAPTLTVDYTDEATRCLTAAERAVRQEVDRDVARRYGSASE